ncbi:MAG: hypothetical protein ACOCWO_05980, partial [Candidatus Muiribacteriaceae bacterium]
RFYYIKADIEYSELPEYIQLYLTGRKLSLHYAEKLKQEKDKWMRDYRNEKVVSYIDSNIKNYDIFIIPWGLNHMKGIEKLIKKQGFEQTSERLVKYDRRTYFKGMIYWLKNTLKWHIHNISVCLRKVTE